MKIALASGPRVDRDRVDARFEAMPLGSTSGRDGHRRGRLVVGAAADDSFIRDRLPSRSLRRGERLYRQSQVTFASAEDTITSAIGVACPSVIDV
jgi:hypothetical protein